MTGVKRSEFLKLACVGWFLAAGTLFHASSCYAQVSSASINGTVKDGSGAVVPDAVVLLRNVDTGVKTHTTTNAQGVYIILSVLPGNYTLETSKPGSNWW
jgi:protocatechuate 3,4-dioxygenase beta subunit